MKKLKMNSIKLKKEKKWYTEKIWFVEQVKIHIVFKVLE